MTIGEAIRKLRIDEGYTVTSFSQLIGISQPTVSQYELGKINPPINRLKQIAKITGYWFTIKTDGNITHAEFIGKATERKASFDERLKNCYLPVYRYCLKYLVKSEDSAKELTQETLYRGLKLHEQYWSEVSMETWLIGIAKKVNKSRRFKLEYVSDYLETDKITDEIEQYFHENHEVFKLIEQLPERQREIMKLSAIGCSYADIAKQFHTTEKTIKSSAYKIRKRLKTCMT